MLKVYDNPTPLMDVKKLGQGELETTLNKFQLPFYHHLYVQLFKYQSEHSKLGMERGNSVGSVLFHK